MLNYAAVIPKGQGLRYVVNLYIMVEQDCVKQAIQQYIINPAQNGMTVRLIDPSRMHKEI